MSTVAVTSGKVYPDLFRTNTNNFWIEGVGCMASLDADAEIHYVWHVPASLPAGTCKLEVLAFSYDANGDAKINPKWKSIAVEEDFDLAVGSLNAEGTTTMTWVTSNDAHQFKRAKITLDADTVVADEFISMRLALESTSWTLNQRSIWLPAVIWE